MPEQARRPGTLRLLLCPFTSQPLNLMSMRSLTQVLH